MTPIGIDELHESFHMEIGSVMHEFIRVEKSLLPTHANGNRQSQSPQHGAISLAIVRLDDRPPRFVCRKRLGRSNAGPAHIHNFCEQLGPRSPKSRANQRLESFACFFGNAPLRLGSE